MSFFQDPYSSQQPEICLGPNGQVVNVEPLVPLPITFSFNNGGFGTPIEGTPLANLVAVPTAVWGLNLIALQKSRGPVPAIEG